MEKKIYLDTGKKTFVANLDLQAAKTKILKAGKDSLVNVSSEQDHESQLKRKHFDETDIYSDLVLRYVDVASKVQRAFYVLSTTLLTSGTSSFNQEVLKEFLRLSEHEVAIQALHVFMGLSVVASASSEAISVSVEEKIAVLERLAPTARLSSPVREPTEFIGNLHSFGSASAQN